MIFTPLLIRAIALALVFAAGAFAMHRYDLGQEAIRENARLEQVRIQAAAHRADERRQSTQVIGAINASRIRESKAIADASGARTALASLRDSLAAIRADLPKSAACPGVERADIAAELFGQCAAALTDLGAKADRLDSDRRTLTDAWPK